MRCAIWCHWYNLKNVEKHPWRSLTLVKLQVKASNFTKSSSPSWVFFTFKIVQIVLNRAKYHILRTNVAWDNLKILFVRFIQQCWLKCLQIESRNLKASVRYFLSNSYFFIKRQSFKNYEKCFLFHLKSSFVLEIFKFL